MNRWWHWWLFVRYRLRRLLGRATRLEIKVSEAERAWKIERARIAP